MRGFYLQLEKGVPKPVVLPFIYIRTTLYSMVLSARVDLLLFHIYHTHFSLEDSVSVYIDYSSKICKILDLIMGPKKRPASNSVISDFFKKATNLSHYLGSRNR